MNRERLNCYEMIKNHMLTQHTHTHTPNKMKRMVEKVPRWIFFPTRNQSHIERWKKASVFYSSSELTRCFGEFQADRIASLS